MLSFFMPIIAGAVRHFFTAVAGILVARGYLQADQMASFVGSSMFFVGFAWSTWQKLNQPEVLAHLNARVSARQVAAKKAYVGDRVAGSMAAATLAIGVLAMPGMGHAAQYQRVECVYGPLIRTVCLKPHKPRKHHAVIARPMYAGLKDLLPKVTVTPPPAMQPQPSALDQLFARIQQASVTDLQYAVALANQAASVTPPTAGSTAAGLRAKCYSAILGVLTTTSSVQASASALQAPNGLASVFTHFETLAQTADALAPMSTVQTACAPVAQAIRMDTAQLVLGIMGGGLGLAKLGVALP